MNEQVSRAELLQQIPVFAIREMVGLHLANETDGPAIRARFFSLLHRRPRDFQKSLQRLTRAQLTLLVTSSPEIGDDEIVQQFEEHRYGSSPSFYIYLFDPSCLDRAALTGFRERFEQALKRVNAGLEQGLPNVRRIELNDLGPLPDRMEVIEATYHFQSRLDYIDEDEKVVSPYQTLYGFFWLNTIEGYVILQARQPDVLKAVRDAIGKAARITLTSLVITKRFKNTLNFLDVKQMRSARLHDPNPNDQRFRWLSITDEELWKKDYKSWEERYPEVASARYHLTIRDKKETMLTIRCEQGALSLAGAVPASLFRDWCLKTLGEIIRLHNAFAANVPEFVSTLDLFKQPEMLCFNNQQKTYVRDLVVALLTVKSNGDNSSPLNVSPLALAAALGKDYARALVSFTCPEPGCDSEEEIFCTCPRCDSARLQLRANKDGWALVCQEHKGRRWTGNLPLKTECSNGHVRILDEEALAGLITLLPEPKLEQAVEGLIGSMRGYSFSQSEEKFYLRGPNLWYFQEKDDTRTAFYIYQNVGVVESGGMVVGVKTARLQPVS